MKVFCHPQALRKGLQAVKRALDPGARIPILTYILLSATDGVLTLSASDLELGVRYQLSAQVEEAGEIALPGTLLCALVAGLPRPGRGRRERPSPSTPVVELAAAVGTLLARASCGDSSASFSGLSGDEFPRIPTLALARGQGRCDETVLLEVGLLRSLVESVSFAAGRSGMRSGLSLVRLTIGEGQLVVALQDETRWAVCACALPDAMVRTRTVVIEARALKSVAALLHASGQAQFSLAIDAQQEHLLFSTTRLDVAVAVKVATGSTGARRPLVSAGATLVVDASELRAALTFVTFVARADGGSVEITADAGQQSLRVRAHAPDLGEQETHVGLIAGAAADALHCQLPLTHLLEVLPAEGTVALQWDAEEHALLVREVKDGSPVRVTYALQSASQR